jgi:predicted GNAT superfamily acetyltransferase
MPASRRRRSTLDMTVEITELSDLEDLQQLADLFALVWGHPGEPLIDVGTLKALAYSGNYVSGAFADGRLIGGLVGWLGGMPPDQLHLHSHVLGVLPGREARGLGFELKQHQRRWCLARGIKVMEWTTDPLVRRNVYFNLTKLGAQAPRYFASFYGEMLDGINKGEDSDRLLIRWQLDSERAEAAAAARLAEPDVEKLRGWGTTALVFVGVAGEPVLEAEGSEARVLICQVPEDIVALRHSNPAVARDWRVALRTALGGALERGYEITGATRSGWLVLEKP